VALKGNGGLSYSRDAYPRRDIHANFRRFYDAYDPARMFWGTDITRRSYSWRTCVPMFTAELPCLRSS